MPAGGRLQFASKGLPLILLVVGGSIGIAAALKGKFELKVRAGGRRAVWRYLCGFFMPVGATLLASLTDRRWVGRRHSNGPWKYEPASPVETN